LHFAFGGITDGEDLANAVRDCCRFDELESESQRWSISEVVT